MIRRVTFVVLPWPFTRTAAGTLSRGSSQSVSCRARAYGSATDSMAAPWGVFLLLPWHKAGEASPLARARAACFERLPGKLAIRAARPRPALSPSPTSLSVRPQPALSPSPTSSQPVPDQLSARPQPALSPSPPSSQPVPDQLSARPRPALSPSPDQLSAVPP